MLRAVEPGLLEPVYETALADEREGCTLRGVHQVPIAVTYEALRIDGGFRTDRVAEEKVAVEGRSVERAAPVHENQPLTHMRLADLRLELLVRCEVALTEDGSDT